MRLWMGFDWCVPGFPSQEPALFNSNVVYEMRTLGSFVVSSLVSTARG